MSDQTPDRSDPPYPGWSVEQPPEHRSGDAGQDSGWGAPGGAGTPSQSGQQGWNTPSGPGAQPPGGQPPGGQPPGGQPPGGQPPGGQPPGWGSGAQWSWQRPQVKPGVIPLRPLGVGEILDGAVTTIRRNIGAMLGLAVVVAALIQLGGLYFNWTMFDSLNEMSTLPANATGDEFFSIFSDLLQASLIYYGMDWLGRTILTGILTVVVSRAVLGEHMTAGDAWRRARPRLLRLLALTILYSLIAIGPALAAGLLTVALGLAGGPGAAALGFILIPAGVALSIWLAIRYVLSAPIIMIETVQPPNGAPVPISIIGSLRRSAALVRNSWWRVLGIYLLIGIIAYAIASAMSFTVSLPATLADPAEGIGFGAVLLLALGGLLATAVTAPFVAGAVALLYVDRRIRAEGLDIELARAAGVTIPGRTETPPAGPAPGGPAPGGPPPGPGPYS